MTARSGTPTSITASVPCKAGAHESLHSNFRAAIRVSFGKPQGFSPKGEESTHAVAAQTSSRRSQDRGADAAGLGAPSVAQGERCVFCLLSAVGQHLAALPAVRFAGRRAFRI